MTGIEMLSMAPEGSFLGKLSKKRTFVVRAVISEADMEEFFHKKGLAAYVFFTNHVSLAYTLLYLAQFASLKNLVAFHKPSTYHEEPEAFYMRRSLDEHRKQFIRKT